MATGTEKLATLSPWMQPRARFLIIYLDILGYRVTVYSTRRTLEQQKELLRIGHTGTLKSKHLIDEALDLIIHPEWGYRVAGEYWTSMGGKWGGHFKNPQLAAAEKAHFEKP